MPQTLRLDGNDAADIAKAAAILRRGGLVAFPTETVYGLGANAFSPAAIGGIFTAKQRPSWDPLIVHISAIQELQSVAGLDRMLEGRVDRLSEAFWPGPLTLLLPRAQAIPLEVTAGRPLVGVRIPSHPVAQALLRATGLPLAAPSANRFGHVSPTTAGHVLDDLDGRIDAVLHGGPTTVGLESTVLDPGQTPMMLYRAGAVTPGMLEEATGIAVQTFVAPKRTPAEPASLPSPGVGIRHYAPEVPLILSGPDPPSLEAKIAASRQRDCPLGVLLPSDWQLNNLEGLVTYGWGAWDDSDSLGQALFAGLRALEKSGAALILCPLPEPGERREALRDRLLKAARPR